MLVPARCLSVETGSLFKTTVNCMRYGFTSDLGQFEKCVRKMRAAENVLRFAGTGKDTMVDPGTHEVGRDGVGVI